MSIMKRRVALLVLTICTFTAFAQETKKNSGYHGIVEFGGATFVAERTPFLGSVNFINGYKFNPSLSLGIGIGMTFDFKHFGEKGSYIIPLYGNFRANLGYDKYQKVVPYIQTGLGVAIASGAQLSFLRQSIGIGFKNSPVSIGFSGEVFRFPTYPIILGLNIGFSF